MRRALTVSSLSIAALLTAFVLAQHFLTRQLSDPEYLSTKPYLNANSGTYMTILQTLVARGKAYSGDGESAWKLRNYYSFGTGATGRDEGKAAQYWAEMAAENGYAPAQEKLVRDTEAKFIVRRISSIPWMENAAAKGWHGATEALERMRKMEAEWKARPPLSVSLLEASAEYGYPDAQQKLVDQAEEMFTSGQSNTIDWMENAKKKGWKGAADALKRMRQQELDRTLRPTPKLDSQGDASERK